KEPQSERHRHDRVLLNRSWCAICEARSRTMWNLGSKTGRSEMRSLDTGRRSSPDCSSRRALSSGAILATVLGVVLVLGGCGGAPDPHTGTLPPSPPVQTAAGTFHGSPARSGELPGLGLRGSPVTPWDVDLGAEIESAPAVADGIVYVGAGTLG